ncbi:MAG: SDR family oxidoreductase [Chloroflexota bacterium]
MLKEKVVLITGASSGFGEDAARLFARRGCIVVLAARRVERLERIAEDIKEEGGTAMAVRLDVVHQIQIDEMVAAVMKEYGRIDILFNNAGFGRLDWLENLDPVKDIDSQIDVNLRGLIQVTRSVLPIMEKQRSGTIINMSSVAGRVAAPLYSIYSATKFGVRGFTEALRREVKPFGIQVCAIYPGGAATEFSQHSGNSKFKRNVKTPTWLRMTSPYVANKVVGLATHPRRLLVIPWWMQSVIWLDAHLPWLVDLAVSGMVRKYH